MFFVYITRKILNFLQGFSSESVMLWSILEYRPLEAQDDLLVHQPLQNFDGVAAFDKIHLFAQPIDSL